MTIRHLIAPAALLALTALACQPASAYDRSITLTAPGGTYTGTVEGSCAGGVCTRDAELTGLTGRTVSRSAECAGGWRFYSCTGTVTGPNGHSATRRVVGHRRFW